jgi:hypothetical protein
MQSSIFLKQTTIAIFMFNPYRVVLASHALFFIYVEPLLGSGKIDVAKYKWL